MLVFEYETPERATRIAAAIRPEVGDIQGDRTTASLSRDDARITVDIEADDLVALRAGLNTWSTLLEAAERVNESGSRCRSGT